jgi:hypothetical protein
MFVIDICNYATLSASSLLGKGCPPAAMMVVAHKTKLYPSSIKPYPLKLPTSSYNDDDPSGVIFFSRTAGPSCAGSSDSSSVSRATSSPNILPMTSNGTPARK